MKPKLSALFAVAGCTVCGLYATEVRAACTPGAQCSVTNGFTENPTNEIFKTSGIGIFPNNAALVAAGNNSTIKGTNLTVTGDAVSNKFAVYANTGGTVDLTDSNVSARTAMVANGATSLIRMTGGTLDVLAGTNNAYGLDLRNGASAVFQDVIVTSAGGTPYVIFVQKDGSFSMTGGSITALNNGVNFGGNTTVKLDQVDITSGLGVVVVNTGNTQGDSTLSVLGGSITMTGGGRAVSAGRGTTLIDGTKITSGGIGIQSFTQAGTLADITAKNFDIQITGTTANRFGVDAYANTIVRLQDGTISTAGDKAVGIRLGLTGTAQALTERVAIHTSGDAAHGVQNGRGTSTLTDTTIAVQGANAYGIYTTRANANVVARTEMSGGSITATNAAGGGVLAERGGSILLDDVKLSSQNWGVLARNNAKIDIKNNSTVASAGANGFGLGFLGDNTASHTIVLENASVTAADAAAVLANGANNMLDITSSTVKGDTLVRAGNCAPPACTDVFGSTLTLRAQGSQLVGHASVADESRLFMDFSQGGNTWTISPSASGTVRSDISDITLGGVNNHIVFDPQGASAWQTLVVGSGQPAGTTVYKVLPGADAHITFNTRLDAGGALGDQLTDRLLINGDVEGDTTIVHVVPEAGGSGAWTSSADAFLPGEGISLIQVSGAASANAFALFGGYVTLGSQPYQYVLNAFGPGADKGQADESQRLVGAGPHWDWRLQSAKADQFIDPDPDPDPDPVPDPDPDPDPVPDPVPDPDPDPDPVPDPGPDPIPDPAPDPGTGGGNGGGGGTGGSNGGGGGVSLLVPQAAVYLSAPNALFQAGLLDLGSLHRRLGDAHRTIGAAPAVMVASAGPVALPARTSSMRDEAFLRSYGGDYRYTSSLGANQYGYATNIRHAAVQGGGNIYGSDSAQHRLRFGLAASVGHLSFKPQNVNGVSKTTMHTWAVSPTFTWQNAAGTYVDAIVSYGRFKGDVSTQTLGKTATLRGKSLAASVETGVAFAAGSLDVEPQAQVVYQRLDFKRTWAQDLGGGFPVALGKLDQWTLRAGGLVSKTFSPTRGDVRLYGKLHVVHTLDGGGKVWLGDDFRLGKSGSALETGLGVDVAFSGGRVYADLTRLNRIGRAGHQGWAFNLGARIIF